MQGAQGNDAVRLHCQTKPHAAAWLAVIPCAAKRTLLPTLSFRCLLRWHLGVPLAAEPSDATQALFCPRCPARLDASGHHLVCCRFNNTTGRHYTQVDTLEGIARRAGFACKREQMADNRTRPGDLFFSRLNKDGPAAVDVTVRDPLAPSHACTPARMADWHEAQEQEKRLKYVVECRRKGWQFVPFVMDVFGGLGREAQETVQTLLPGLLGQKEGWQRRSLEASVWQDISFSLMKAIGKQLAWSIHGECKDLQVGCSNAPYAC